MTLNTITAPGTTDRLESSPVDKAISWQAREVLRPGQSAGRGRAQRLTAILVVAGVSLALAGCGSRNTRGTPGVVDSFGGFIGGVAADEPRAAYVARDVLSAGGSAADAAVAAYFTMAVTMPGAASLGGGGACVVFDKQRKQTTSLVFPIRKPATGGAIGIPGNVRGFALLHGRYGRLRWETVLAPADLLARGGEPASRAHVMSLRQAGESILSEPSLAAISRAPNGGLMSEGQPMRQLELSAVLSRLRTAGGGDFYAGQLGRQIVEAANQVGGQLTTDDLRNATLEWQEPIKTPYFRNTSFFFAPTTGGQYAAYLLEAGAKAGGFALGKPSFERDAMLRDLARIHDGIEGGAPVGSVGSAGISVMDRDGQAVACTVSMGKAFGMRKMTPGLGILLAGMPSEPGDEAPYQTAMVAGNVSNWGAMAAGAATGGAPAAASLAQAASIAFYDSKTPLISGVVAPRVFRAGSSAVIMHEPGIDRRVLERVGDPNLAIEVPRLGNVNLLFCREFLPEEPDTCAFANDNRGYGLSFGDERVNTDSKQPMDKLDARRVQGR